MLILRGLSDLALSLCKLLREFFVDFEIVGRFIHWILPIAV